MSRRKTSIDDTVLLFEEGLHIPTRLIYPSLDDDPVDGGKYLGGEYAAKIIKALHILNSIGPEPITLIINCPGGDIIHGFAIYDAIENSQAEVHCVAIGEAASMAGIILQAGASRTMSQNCRLMLHDGYHGLDGTMREVEKEVEHEKYWRLKTYSLLAERTGLKKALISRKMSGDWNLTAEEALKYNLIDKVLGNV